MSARRYVGTAEIAEYLGTNVSHIRRLVLQRQIPFTKLGGKLRFDLRRIDQWLDANAVEVSA